MASLILRRARLGLALASWCVVGVAWGQGPPSRPEAAQPKDGTGASAPRPAPRGSAPSGTPAAPSPRTAEARPVTGAAAAPAGEATREPAATAPAPAGEAAKEPAAAKGTPAPETPASTDSSKASKAGEASPESADRSKAGEAAPDSTDRSGASTVVVHEVGPQGAALDLHEPPPPPVGEAHASETRKAELGGVVGTLFRSADGGDVTYSAGLAYGGYARVQIREWITARLMVTQSDHAVEIRQGALGIPSTTLEQPDMTLLDMSARAEPTWVVSPELRLRAALGIGWSRVTVPAPTSRGALTLTGTERYGVMLDATAGVSASYDLIVDRLALELAVDGGVAWGESGSAFKKMQVFDAEGHRHSMDAMPTFNGTFSALVGLGLVL